MRHTHAVGFAQRRGTVLPMIAVCLVAIFAFTALAIDLGMLAVSRTQCQNAADAAVLAGCRTLNNNSSNANSNLSAAVATARTVATSNSDMGANYTTTQVSEIDVGQYLYNAATQTFGIYNGFGVANQWTNVTSGSAASPASGSWTAMQVTISYTQPMVFLTVLGVNSMPTGAAAAAVYRPRDTTFVVDMTSSMAYASQFNYNAKSNNPDTLAPRFGHYYTTRTNCIQNTNQYTSDGQCISQNNYCVYTPSGPPIIRDFVYDPTNINNPSTPAYPITSNSSSLLNAFHRWSPPESGANSLTYLGPTYNFSGYNAFDKTNTSGPTPAPDSFIDQFDSGSITYVGDRWPRKDGKVWTTPTSTSNNTSGNPYPSTNPTPAWNDPTSGAVNTALDYLGLSAFQATGSAPSVPTGTLPQGASYSTSWSNYRDPVWETYGYDLNMAAYRVQRGAAPNTLGTPIDPASFTASQNNTYAQPNSNGTWPVSGNNTTPPPASNRFKGYSMGPGYWGKTFFVWPPDPRFSTNANTTSPDPFYPAFDASGNPMCDWRKHFFVISPSSPFKNINQTLFNSGSGMTLSSYTSFYQINYSAILKWIKSGPQVLPPNLRAGRIVYYSSIPDDVNTATVSGQAQLDKVFWKNYINYVLGYSMTSSTYLYGQSDNVSKSMTGTTSGIQYAWDSQSISPYMNYSDSPLRPRLHFWFGPLSMVDFISGVTTGANWNPGTCHESQCWQLKVAMNSTIAALQNDHPNDTLGMVMFASQAYNGPRVPQGQNYSALQNALFYPNSLLSLINNGDTTTEERPYNTNFATVLAGDEIPNANGNTDPNTGLTYAFNLLSASNQLPSATYGMARRGASKLIILETDGVPNGYRGTTGAQGMVPTQLGYDTYFPTAQYYSGNLDDGDPNAMSQAYTVVQQITKQMANAGQSSGSSANSGLSLPNAPALVYPIAFGDVFDTNLAPNASIRPTALQFLANVAAYGNTGPTGATTLPSSQVIVGDYTTRINTLQSCLQSIFQTGVTVALIE